MELKLRTDALRAGVRPLLIVPYGIETDFAMEAFVSCFGLLIVPYGIETRIQTGCIS